MTSGDLPQGAASALELGQLGPYLRGDVAQVERVPHGLLAPLVVGGGGQVPAVEAAAAVVGVGGAVILVHRVVLLEVAGGAVRGAAERVPVELLDDPERAAAPRVVAQHVGLAAPQLRQPGQPVLAELGAPRARRCGQAGRCHGGQHGQAGQQPLGLIVPLGPAGKGRAQPRAHRQRQHPPGPQHGRSAVGPAGP